MLDLFRVRCLVTGLFADLWYLGLIVIRLISGWFCGLGFCLRVCVALVDCWFNNDLVVVVVAVV